jgi:hypothetical protein
MIILSRDGPDSESASERDFKFKRFKVQASITTLAVTPAQEGEKFKLVLRLGYYSSLSRLG